MRRRGKGLAVNGAFHAGKVAGYRQGRIEKRHGVRALGILQYGDAFVAFRNAAAPQPRRLDPLGVEGASRQHKPGLGNAVGCQEQLAQVARGVKSGLGGDLP
jgi:hypothetical protein